MNYKSLADLAADTRRLARELPKDVDLVVGIPRSGLLVANYLCLYLDVPMTDVEGLLERKVFDSGNRLEGGRSFEESDSVLVVDDTVNTGVQMTETRARLEECTFPFDVRYGAPYISPGGYEYVDHWVEVVPHPRVFEWNVLHHPMLKTWCVAIEGVLCREPTPEEDDDGEDYREYVSGVEPDILPNQRIGWIVTHRSEEYRNETERWLADHGVEYDTLVMRDRPNGERGAEPRTDAEYKAEIYGATDARLFIENERDTAAEICRLTSKPVFSVRTFEMVRPGQIRRSYRRSADYLSRFRDDPLSFALRASRYVSSRLYHKVRR